MKKILSILLVCAMLLSLGITATAAETAQTNDTVIEQIDRIDAASLSGGKEDYDGQYTGILYPQTNTNDDYTGSLKIAHDGDYLYLVSYTSLAYANRTTVEMHIYIELGDVTYQIVALPNYAPYATAIGDGYYVAIPNSDGQVSGASAYNSGSEYGYRFGVFTSNPSINKVQTQDALDYGIMTGRNKGITNDSKVNDYGGHEIVIPMPESLRSALGNGENVGVKIGFTYMLQGNNNNYTTTGTAPAETPSNWRAWANSGSTNALVDVTLQGDAQNTDAEIADTEIIGVQTTTIGEAGTTYSARFVAKLDTSVLANAKVGFRFVGDKTVDKNCTTVFNSILANGKAVPAWYLGADYLYCINLNDLVVGQTYALQIAAYYMDGDTVVPGTLYNVSIAADGTISANPLA